jgi:hypothetical protein
MIVGYVLSHKVGTILGISLLSIHDPEFGRHLAQRTNFGFTPINAQMSSMSNRFISDFCAMFRASTL